MCGNHTRAAISENAMVNQEEKQEGIFASALNGAIFVAIVLMFASLLFIIYNKIIGV